MTCDGSVVNAATQKETSCPKEAEFRCLQCLQALCLEHKTVHAVKWQILEESEWEKIDAV